MFLIGDESYRHGRFPWVTGLLIIINVAVFVGQSFLGESFTQWLQPDTRRDHVGGKISNGIKIHQGKTRPKDAANALPKVRFWPGGIGGMPFEIPGFNGVSRSKSRQASCQPWLTAELSRAKTL